MSKIKSRVDTNNKTRNTSIIKGDSMTVYNITNLLDKHTQLSIKAFLNTNKLTITYSEFSNRFGIRTDRTHNKSRYNIALDKINKIFGSYPIVGLINCPKIDLKNFKKVHNL